MLRRLQSGKEVGKHSAEYLKELNSEDIYTYKFIEMQRLGLKPEEWKEHPIKVLIHATKIAVANDNNFRIFRNLVQE